MKINNTDINENFIEQQALATLQKLGWNYRYGVEIGIDDELSVTGVWRNRSDEVIFKPLLEKAIQRLNPQLPHSTVEEVIRIVCRSEHLDLSLQNQTAYKWLREGIAVSYQKDGEQINDVVSLIDFQNTDNNDFLAVNQLSINGTKTKRIPDVICYINGLPIVVMELKNPLAENADIDKAYTQIQTYKNEISDLFIFNQAVIISDGTNARIGSLTADFGRFTPWRVVDEKQGSQRISFENELESLINGILSPQALLDYIQNFVVFEKDEKNHIIKKIGAYHQYYGVNEVMWC